ncbi:hypothetical protein [Anatilimnocola floriformis]|uniref:hypothetical protein n=1 Tax=Anatilimnocola floriformis TaxID=2948575 RepID=UPI0020C3A38D|nr:hypothetical protein [Anatilimnocola floriformis]
MTHDNNLIRQGSRVLIASLIGSALLTQTGCPLATETSSAGVGGVAPPAAQVLAQAVPEKPAAKEEPKKNSDANPDANRRPKADRTPRKPGDPIKITFDNIILGMQADIPFRPWMLKDEVKDLEGQRISITGVMHGNVDKPKANKKFILLRNKECKYGPGGQADHLAMVEMKPGQAIDFTTATVVVEGKLKIVPETGDDGNTWSLYILEDATAKVQ